MKKIISSFFIILFGFNISFAQVSGGNVATQNVIIQEEDGVPKGKLRTLKVPNTSLTKNAEGDYSFDFIGGSLPTTYLKLDQSTPQTTTGTFTFPSLILGTGSAIQEFTLYGDATLSDVNPNLEFRISTDNTAYDLHFNADGANDPWGVWQLWKGTDTGTGFSIVGSPIMWGDSSKNVYIPASLSVVGSLILTTPLDISSYTNLTGGRSMTMNGDAVDADAELYTTRINCGLESPVATDDDILQWEPAGAFTITEVACSTDTGTATINFNENVNTTPNTAGTAILNADIVCDTDRQSSCASGCDVNTISNAGITAGNLVSMVVTSVDSAPTKLRIHIKGVYDD